VSSVSRPSASVVNPTRSANMMETRRRSATGASGGGRFGGRFVAAAGGPAASDAPHSPQKLRVRGRSPRRTAGQPDTRRRPRFPAELCGSASFSVAQLEQITWAPRVTWRTERSRRDAAQPPRSAGQPSAGGRRARLHHRQLDDLARRPPRAVAGSLRSLGKRSAALFRRLAERRKGPCSVARARAHCPQR